MIHDALESRLDESMAIVDEFAEWWSSLAKSPVTAVPMRCGRPPVGGYLLWDRFTSGNAKESSHLIPCVDGIIARNSKILIDLSKKMKFISFAALLVASAGAISCDRADQPNSRVIKQHKAQRTEPDDYKIDKEKTFASFRLGDPTVPNDKTWEALVSRYPEIASGDSAILSSFGRICEDLTEEERFKLAGVLIDHLSDPILGASLNEFLSDARNREMINISIVKSLDVERLDEAVPFIKSLPSDANRIACGQALLKKLSLENDRGRIFSMIEAIATEEADRQKYLGSLVSRLDPLRSTEKFSSEATREAFVKDLLPMLPFGRREDLVAILVVEELTSSGIQSLTQSSQKWDVSIGSVLNYAMSSENFKNTLNVDNASSVLDELPENDPLAFSIRKRILDHLISRSKESEIVGMVERINSDTRDAPVAQELGRIYKEDLGLQRAKEVAEFFTDGRLRESYLTGCQ